MPDPSTESLLATPISVEQIAKWLPTIFPEGIPNRSYVIREMSAKTLFVMMYSGAVEGTERWLRPDQVTKMTNRQAAKSDPEQRVKWAKDSITPGKMKNVPGRWYASNTREPIRDETLRSGLVALGAVVERKNIPASSARPRYAVASDFAELLIQLSSSQTSNGKIIAAWQQRHLSATALNRVELLRRGAIHIASSDRIKVVFPNGETRLMLPGPSTIITKAVIEEFAVRFLRQPGVIFLTESREKVVARDEELAGSMGLNLDFARNLPDVVLVDVAVESPKLVFVEVVATDGAITEKRKEALLEVAGAGGFNTRDVFFVTAFADRDTPAFRRLAAQIAWGSFTWFAAEPDKLLIFRDGIGKELPALLAQ